ncbi:CBF/Mak21 family protein, partial [Entamoeba invadens IP1]|uniref:CBF/Mak21 family protein n=1 Tax=Entamoeba invadens IP1 TaxID=370355 RepID=UPI0002C3F99D
KEERKKVNTKGQFTRRQLKVLRIERKLDKDVRLVEAKYSSEEKKKYNMLVLDTVFRTYFRILKTNLDSPMIPMVLEGMALHTYKINYDFLMDIIKLLEQLLTKKADGLCPLDTVRVCYTIFNTMKLQSFMINVDNVKFYDALYKTIGQIAFEQKDFIGKDNVKNRDMLVGSLKIMLLDIKTVPPLRVAAFVKRLLLLMLNCDASIALDLRTVMTYMFKRYKDTFINMIDEEGDIAEFNNETDQPDHSKAADSCLWEFDLLRYHINPDVRKWVLAVKGLLIRH